jgi:DNA mismatch repair ATPase MutL
VDRHENQRYKEWSIGYRGEALCSLARCSELKIITKFYRAQTGYEVTYNDNGDVVSVNPVEKDKQGTIIQIRNIHKNNKNVQLSFRKNRESHYNFALTLMNDFSLILKDVTLILSNEFLKQRGKDFQKTIRHFWQTHGVGDYYLNLMEILNNQYHRGPFVDTPKEIFEFSTTYKKIKIQIFLTKPSKNGAKVMLTKKNLHHFLNRKPVDIVLPFKTIFYELY